MANPFLMTEEELSSVPDDNGVACNPFLIQDEPESTQYDNPFSNQANNPFADFGEEEMKTSPDEIIEQFEIEQPVVRKTTRPDLAMSFFGTTIDHDDGVYDDKQARSGQVEESTIAYSSDDELTKKKPIPPRPAPPFQKTQELIFAITDQLDQASSNLLDKIPKTRTPSPVSMRDLHSPSPDPGMVSDLLDATQEDSSIIINEDTLSSDLLADEHADNPFATDKNVTQPTRPPPPRPAPPRPVPPAPSAPPAIPPMQNIVQQQPQQQDIDLFDMFGDSVTQKKPQPKTKEDILSLFSIGNTNQQQQSGQPDLLSGDILLNDITNEETALPPPFSEPLSQPIIPPAVTATAATLESTVPIGQLPLQDLTTVENTIPSNQTEVVSTTTIIEPEPILPEEVEPDITPSVEVETKDSIAPEVTYKRAPTPDIEITTVESLPRSDDEEDVQKEELEHDDKSESDQSSHTIESNAATHAFAESPMELISGKQIDEPEQMDTGLDFAPSVPSESTSANPFGTPETEVNAFYSHSTETNIFSTPEPISATPATNVFAAVQETPVTTTNIFATEAESIPPSQTNIFATNEQVKTSDEFDAFAAKFDSVKKDNVSLLDGFGAITPTSTGDAWGDDALVDTNLPINGFGIDEGFDSFLAMKAPEPSSFAKDDFGDSPNEEKEFNVVIRPKEPDNSRGVAPVLAPPPPPRGSQNNSIYSGDSSPRLNPFDKSDEAANAEGVPAIPEPAAMTRTDSQETPPTPLFDDDVSQPLEDFPRIHYTGPGWEMQLRQPNKKKITGQRFWKKIFIRLVFQGDNPVLQLFNQSIDKEPFQELPLQPSYSVSEIGAQQYDQFGKIFTIKLQYIFYKERPGVRPGQVTKAERITNKLSQFAAYAIQGDYQGVKEFGSDLKKLGLPVEHAPQVSQLFKIGSMSYEDLKQFSVSVEEALFKLSAHRDRALTYKFEEVQITAVDEISVEQDAEGHVNKQIARVRLFFLGFLSGMPTIELGLNDMWRQGKEVVGRHDIIPVVTEEWIRLEGVEFHNCVQQDEYERSRTIKFQPPDACYIELMRFRVRPPKNRELPLQVKATWCVTGNKVELRADLLVPGFASRKLGQIPCEDVSIRFPIPECWIYLFRVEKHFRYGSVKSAHRRTGKIKGIERILGTVDTLQESLIEVTSGQAKYEHHHRAIVWRCPRLPKEGQGAYTTHQMVCRMALTSYDQIPEQLAPYCYVEFTMPATQVSHTTVRSVSVQDSDSDEPPEKYVRYLARHEYRVGIEHTTGESINPYLAATKAKEPPAQPAPPPVVSPMAPSDSDSESN